ncbi:hypothetical protein [Spiroplasma endosymbiont of Virgichneumon dumeticola]|uniref:hypothetical protein n=1 Tax=Spiroplasma endosymbiont of Virgichneumon dumeticola TaxID=3139323 RepID=UPI0035C87F69
MENNKIDYDYDLFKKRYFDFLNQETKQQITASKEKISGVYIIYLELKAINNMIPMYICHSVNIKSAFSIYKNRIKKLRTSPHMYLWRKQWNWMSSIILFKLKNNVLHI